jgi:hypothetical protein
MTRDVVLALGVLSIALLACNSNPPATNPNGGGEAEWVEMNHKDMGDDAYKLPTAFAILSQKHGCEVKATDDATVAKCNDGTIGMARQGTMVTVMCKAMTKNQCSALFDAIVNEK